MEIGYTLSSEERQPGELVKLAQRALRYPAGLTPLEIKALAGSVLSQANK